jgi:hypothetical protein
MKFSQFLEMSDTTGLVPVVPIDSVEKVNDFLFALAESPVASPESALTEIRQTLGRFGITIPTMYDLDLEGQEFIVNLSDQYYLYFAYSLDDDSTYVFHAEIADQEGIDEILSIEDDEEEEEGPDKEE